MDSYLLWNAAIELSELLQANENREARYQKYFEDHPIIFNVLGFDQSASFEKRSINRLPYCKALKMSPEPDFICASTKDGHVAIVELKTPFSKALTTARSDGNRKKFRADIASYISQVEEYIECIEGNDDARKIVKETLSVIEISSYSAIIIYGIEKNNSKISSAKLCDRSKRSINIISFDEVLEKILSIYAVGRMDNIDQDGFCFAAVIMFERGRLNERNYLLDIGDLEHDRVSCFVENETLVIEIRDQNGRIHRSEARCPFRIPTPIIFQFSNSEQGFFVTCNLGGRDVDHQFRDIPLKSNPNISNHMVGADLNGENGGQFGLLCKVIFDRTLGIEGRLVCQRYLRDVIKPPYNYIEFDGTKCMRNVGTALVAPSNEQRPIFRKSS